MRIPVQLAIALSALCTPYGAMAQTALEPFDIAITVDDLSGLGTLPPGMTRTGIVDKYLDVLKQHRVPEAYGFVNAKNIERDKDGAAVLDRWISAGYPLGNHGYAHLNLNSASTIQEWEADVTAGEPEVERRMGKAAARYYRFPNLTGGGGKGRHDAAIAFLTAGGYRLGEVSISFDDWAYVYVFSRCLSKRDFAAIDQMKARYLKEIDEGIVYMRTLSKQTYGRVIPQVLLTHLSGWSAIMLPDVLDRLEKAGARYVPLANAQKDSAYLDHPSLIGDQVVTERTAKAKGLIVDRSSSKLISDLEGLCK